MSQNFSTINFPKFIKLIKAHVWHFYTKQSCEMANNFTENTSINSKGGNIVPSVNPKIISNEATSNLSS